MDRRGFLKGAAAGGAFLAAGGVASNVLAQNAGAPRSVAAHAHHGHLAGLSVERQHPDAMTPMEYLTHFDTGKVSRLADGTTLREYEITAYPRDLTVAKGITYPGWTFNGMAPGPTLRATEGDRMRIKFFNGDSHPHSLHFHGIHPANMDGVFEQIEPGGSFVYEFDAEPFGCHLYHCHTPPVAKHMSKGLFGAFIVDPKEPRERAKEMVMVMNGWDVDFDGGNEFYTVNGIANYYLDYPIPLKVGEKVRVYLVNVTEFDLINSFHLHANFFKWWRTGTRLDNYEITDTVMLCQGERGILEFEYKYPGKYMFHAHQSEFSDLGWLGLFDVTP